MELLSTFYSSPGFCTEKMYLYGLHDLTPGKATEENDQIEVVLMTPEEAWDAVERGEVADAKSILALALHRCG
jgi:ADP-ribose pyrophosphatase